MTELTLPTTASDLTTTPALSPADLRALIEAIDALEHPGLAAKIAIYSGKPLDMSLRLMPGAVNRQFQNVARVAVVRCLRVAVKSLQTGKKITEPSWLSKVLGGISGGIGGFLGPIALPVEIPVTTVIMLRTIAGIAETHGEDTQKLSTLLACLAVFALGARDPYMLGYEDYYSARERLDNCAAEAAPILLERGAIHAASPVVAKLIGELAARFGLIVTDMTTAALVPVVGAVGGAAVNMIFIDHFEKVAHAHFTMRSLERTYGLAAIKSLYREKRNELNRK